MFSGSIFQAVKGGKYIHKGELQDQQDTSKKLMQSINSPEMFVFLKQKYYSTSKILPLATNNLRTYTSISIYLSIGPDSSLVERPLREQ